MNEHQQEIASTVPANIERPRDKLLHPGAMIHRMPNQLVQQSDKQKRQMIPPLEPFRGALGTVRRTPSSRARALSLVSALGNLGSELT